MPELNFDKIISLNAEGDKATSASIGVFNGYASLTVWSSSLKGAPLVRIPLGRATLVKLRHDLQKLINSGKPGDNFGYNFSKWDNETKTSSNIGSVRMGRDDKALFAIGVQIPKHPPIKFVLKTPISFDTSEAMSDVQRSELAAQTMVDQLTYDVPYALALTSFKREAQRSGGNGGSGGDPNFF